MNVELKIYDMKNLLLILVLFFCALNSFAQSDNFRVVTEQDAHYPAGEQMLFQYISEHIVYPQSAIGQVVDGSVMLSFDVLPDSTLTSFLVLSGINLEINNAVVSVLKEIKFAPALQSFFAVKQNVMITVPLRAKPE